MNNSGIPLHCTFNNGRIEIRLMGKTVGVRPICINKEEETKSCGCDGTLLHERIDCIKRLVDERFQTSISIPL